MVVSSHWMECRVFQACSATADVSVLPIVHVSMLSQPSLQSSIGLTDIHFATVTGDLVNYLGVLFLWQSILHPGQHRAECSPRSEDHSEVVVTAHRSYVLTYPRYVRQHYQGWYLILLSLGFQLRPGRRSSKSTDELGGVTIKL